MSTALVSDINLNLNHKRLTFVKKNKILVATSILYLALSKKL